MPNFQSLQQQIQGFVGDKHDDTLSKIRQWINEGQLDIWSAHEWWFKRATLTPRLNTVAPYQTGTVVATNGSDAITITSGSFSGLANYKFATDPAAPFFRITAVASNGLSATLERPFTEDSYSGAPFIYKDEYDLGSAVGTIEKAVLLRSGYTGMSHVFLSRLEDYSSVPCTAGVPRGYYVVAAGGNSIVLGLRPIPDAAYPVDIRYERKPVDMADNDDEPSLPDEFVPLIVDYAHWRAAMLDHDPLQAEMAYRTYKRALSEKIGTVRSRTSPDFCFGPFDGGWNTDADFEWPYPRRV